MLKTVNPAYPPMNFFMEFNIGSFGGENEIFTFDQDYTGEKLNRFSVPQEIHLMMNPIYEKETVRPAKDEIISRLHCDFLLVLLFLSM